ncbi:hypothetical protein SLEP1_g22674 [Rubroshorea leprosula]|uniref:Uncharacterized protein n=1 Tax=Rubroshorea leprosula TaxID=152421 RepID=A0AAV5JFY8_9ROSI|nr:hypothetical protein SLEP1_g22674 [Rubroshorea leprosula]
MIRMKMKIFIFFGVEHTHMEFFGLFLKFEIDYELRIFLVNSAWFCL